MKLDPKQTSVVLLAAGHGKRMLPLTEHTPKPLLMVGELSLIEHHLIRIVKQGFLKVIINIAYLGEQIKNHLGNGERFNCTIAYSDETASGALETAGGLQKALPLIESEWFITINADIWTDYDCRALLSELPTHARLVMVDNPAHNPAGDFVLDANGRLAMPSVDNKQTLTYSGIAIYHRHLFETLLPGKQALAPIFRNMINTNSLQGVKLDGEWRDIGTPERLQELRESVSHDS